jgi:O-antigen/teichoic acid export membrane protein
VTEQGGMRGRVLGGLRWTGASEAVMQVVRMLTAVVLARLLAPDDYGLAALALVFASLVLVFSDLALGAAIVQRKVLTELDRATAFWLSVGTGVVFTVLGVALSGPVASFYGEPSIGPLCAALSFSFVITSLATTHEALMLREMQFARLEKRVMIATIAGAAAGVAVGIKTHDAWAIIAQQLTHSCVSTVLLWRLSPWRPSLRFSGASLRSLGSFSGYLVGHRLLYYLHRNADNILIGRFVGATALGAYTLAYNIMLVPMSRIAGPLQKVLGPTFARMQDEPARIADAWVRIVRLLGMISIPSLLGLVVVAPDFVHVVLGDAWAPAVPLIQVLAWVGLLQSLQSINTDILQARGLTSTIFRFTILFSGAHFLAFVIGLQWGVVGVAVAYAISSTLVEPIYTWLTARSIGISPWRIAGAVRGVFEAGLIMAGALLALRAGLLDLGVPAFFRLAILVPVGSAVFGLASLWRAPAAWADVRGLAVDLPGADRLRGLNRRRRAITGLLAKQTR